jgi:hypothetical protein
MTTEGIDERVRIIQALADQLELRLAGVEHSSAPRLPALMNEENVIQLISRARELARVEAIIDRLVATSVSDDESMSLLNSSPNPSAIQEDFNDSSTSQTFLEEPTTRPSPSLELNSELESIWYDFSRMVVTDPEMLLLLDSPNIIRMWWACQAHLR